MRLRSPSPAGSPRLETNRCQGQIHRKSDSPPFLRGACGTPGVARTFGTCEGDTRDRMVRTSRGDGVGIAAPNRLRAATILRWWCETAPHGVDRELHF